jgi:integrase
MATGNITKRMVDGLSPGPSDSFVWDQEVKGFGLKLTRSGGRTYVYQYRVGGRGAKVQRYTIGRHGKWTPDQARKEAKRLAVLVDQGIDPAAADKVKRREAIDLAFPAYVERFIESYLKLEWKGGFDLASGLLRGKAVPVFAGKTIKQIGRGDISGLMDKLATAPATRRNTFAVLRRMFKWAVNRGDLEVSPIRDMEPPPAPPSRDRVLTDTELAYVWAASIAAGYPFGPFLRMLILTGQRREEVAGLEWSELDRDRALWTLPANRAKNGVTHDVPLSAATVDLLDEVAARVAQTPDRSKWPRKGFVLTTTGEKPVRGYSAAKSRLDKLTAEVVRKVEGDEAAAIAPWRFHDLRRTVATGFQRLGVRFEVTEAVLNHVSGSRSGVAGVYQRHHWSDEKRAALDAWAAHVSSLAVPVPKRRESTPRTVISEVAPVAG